MNTQGFNLLELCICMSITLILSGSVYYGYQQHKQSLDARQAQIYLHDIALQLEEHQDIKTGYQNLNLNNLGLETTKYDYEFSVSANTSTYIITARPDFQSPCGTIMLDQSGKLNTEKTCTII